MTDVSRLDLAAIKAKLDAPYSRRLKMALRSLHRPFNENNDRAARSGKKVGRKSQFHRRERVKLCLRQLHAIGYEIEDGASLGQKHLRVLMRYWLECGLTASTIQNHLSALRTYLSWIGKGGMVGPAEDYLPTGVDPERIRVVSVAQNPKGWAENNVDLPAMMRRLVAKDARVAVVLLVAGALGLRRREAAVFRPGVHLDRFGGTITLGRKLEVSEGTKGGRLRAVPVDRPHQMDVIHLALHFIQRRGDSLVPPGMNLEQFDHRISYVLRATGLNKESHCNPHAMRHTYSVALYEALTGYQAPVRGNGRFTLVDGDPSQVAEALAAAERVVAENLGHNRPQVSRAYLGGLSTGHKVAKAVHQHRATNPEGGEQGEHTVDQ